MKLGERIKYVLSPEDKLPPVDEGWWIDVLYDRRTRWPHELRLPIDSPYAHLQIDRLKKEVIVLKCDRCRLRREYQRDELMRGFGPDFNRVVMRYKLHPCPHQHSDAVFADCHLGFE